MQPVRVSPPVNPSLLIPQREASQVKMLGKGRVLIALTLCLIVSQAAGTRSGSGKEQTAGEWPQAQQANAESAELNEAQRLSLSVVELYKAGKYDEALPLAKRALEIKEKVLGAEHPELASALNNLAELYLVKGKYSEAGQLLQRLLKIQEKSFGPEDVRLAPALGKLAFTRFIKSDFGEAEALYQRALAIREKKLTPDDLEVARSLFELAEFNRLRGRYEKAEPLFKRAIAIRGKKLGPKDPEVKRAMDRYSCIYYEQKESVKVKDLWKQFDFFNSSTDTDQTQEVLNGKALSLPRPGYPVQAKINRVSGTVVVKVVIDETGKVMSAKDMCGGHPYLRSAAEQAALQARFTPTQLKGQPVKVEGVITYNFVGR
jgi:TonB family protein